MAKRRRRWERWDRRDYFAWGGAALIAILGYVAAVSILPNLFFAAVDVDKAAGTFASTYSGKCLLCVVAAAVVMGVVGWRLGTDHVAYNWGFLAGGALILVLGLPWLALEKVAATPEALVVRSWWGLYRFHLPFAQVEALPMEHHHQPWRRRSTWLSLHYRLKDGSTGTLCRDLSHHPLWSGAHPYLLLFRRVPAQR